MLLGPVLSGWAQVQPVVEDSARVRIEMNDGSVFVGTIVSEDEETIRFRTDSNIDVTLARADVLAIERLEGGRSRNRPDDPNPTRLFFSPTGRSLKAGEGYFAVYELFFPFIGFGVGNVATLAGGVSLVPGIGTQLFYAAPKITFYQGSKVDLAAGVLVGGVPGETGYGGVLYGVGTYGTSKTAVTAGVGFGFAQEDVASEPVVLLGLEHRLGDNTKLISENFVFPTAELLVLSGGVRFFGDTLSADLGFFSSPDVIGEGGFPFFPWIGFVYGFGR
jgi:hypothetical protein